jgi:hypothetical protein
MIGITRSYILIYTLSLLILFTRIQLNLLGRRNYLSSVMSMATAPANASTISLEDHDDDDPGNLFGNDFETNRRYLTFSWWLLHRGWKELMEKVKSAVEEVFTPLNPREDINLEKLSELTLEVRKKVEGATEEERRYGLHDSSVCQSCRILTLPSMTGNGVGFHIYCHHRNRRLMSSKSPVLSEQRSLHHHKQSQHCVISLMKLPISLNHLLLQGS